MKKIVLISKIANLAKAIEKDFSMNTANDRMHRSRAKRAGMTHEKAAALVQSVTASEEDENRTTLSSDNHATEVDESPFIIDPTKKDRLTGNLTEAQRLKLNTCLGAWEEPEKAMGVVVGLNPKYEICNPIELHRNSHVAHSRREIFTGRRFGECSP